MIGQKGQQFIQSWEKCKLEAFQDEAGIWTIGWGSITIYDVSEKSSSRFGSMKRSVRKGDILTQGQADFLFQEELDLIAKNISSLVQQDLLMREIDALTSLVYNIGIGAFKNSTLRKLVVNRVVGDEMKAEFMKWKYIHKDGMLTSVSGLLTRREAEYTIYETGVYNNHA